MSFGKLGAMGRGFGHLGALGGVGNSGTPPTAFALTDIASGRLFQRTKTLTTGPVSASGTYSGGTPNAVELQVRKVSDNTVVKAWTTATAGIAGGNWSATITGVPQGGSYYVEARPSNATGLAKTGSNPFFVGIMLVLYGQSNMLNMSFATDGSPPSQGALTTYYSGSAWTAVPAANGVRELLNAVATATGLPVAAMNGAVSGQSIANLSQGAGTGYFETLAGWIAAVGDAEMILWHQGEGNGDGAGSGIATWSASLSTLHTQLVTATGRTKAQMPLALATLSTSTTTATDANWDAMQAQIILAASNSNTYLSHSNMDAVRVDTFHYNGVSQGRQGKRFAQTVATILGVSSGYPRSSIASAATVDATHTDVTLSHDLGTDFTPTSGITGFEVSGDNGGSWNTPSAAARTSATVLRLTHTSLATNSQRKLRYQYGLLPDVSAPLLNNGTPAGPLLMSAGNISPTPLSVTPVPSHIVTKSSGLSFPTASSVKWATVSIGAASNDRFVILSISNRQPTALTGATIQVAGQSDIAMTIQSATAVNASIAFAYALVPSAYGTTADIVLQYAGSIFSNPSCAVYTVDQTSLSSLTPVATQGANGASVTTISTNLATTSGGFVLAASCNNDAGGTSMTYTGSTESYTIRTNILFSGGVHSHADVSGVGTNASSAVTVNGASANTAVGAISFR